MQILDGLVLTDLIGFIGNPAFDNKAMPKTKIAKEEKVLGSLSEEAKQVCTEIYRLKMVEEKYIRPIKPIKFFSQSELARQLLLKEIRSRLRFLNAYLSHVVCTQFKLWSTSKKIGLREDWMVVTYELKGRKKALETSPSLLD